LEKQGITLERALEQGLITEQTLKDAETAASSPTEVNMNLVVGEVEEVTPEIQVPVDTSLSDDLANMINESRVFEKPGVSIVFEETPELGKIGTQQEYSQYLGTIFPGSQIRDIMYHGSTNKITEFQKGKGFTSDAIWFDKNRSTQYGDNVTSALINVTNTFQRYGNSPQEYIDTKYGKFTYRAIRYHLYDQEILGPEVPKEAVEEFRYFQQESHPDEEGSQFIKQGTINEYKKYGNFDSIDGQGYLGVFESEQIHILGTQQDIQQFKQWKQSQVKTVPEIGTAPSNSQPLTLQTLDKIYSATQQRNGLTPIEVFEDLIKRGHTFIADGYNPFSKCL